MKSDGGLLHDGRDRLVTTITSTLIYHLPRLQVLSQPALFKGKKFGRVRRRLAWLQSAHCMSADASRSYSPTAPVTFSGLVEHSSEQVAFFPNKGR